MLFWRLSRLLTSSFILVSPRLFPRFDRGLLFFSGPLLFLSPPTPKFSDVLFQGGRIRHFINLFFLLSIFLGVFFVALPLLFFFFVLAVGRSLPLGWVQSRSFFRFLLFSFPFPSLFFVSFFSLLSLRVREVCSFLFQATPAFPSTFDRVDASHLVLSR